MDLFNMMKPQLTDLTVKPRFSFPFHAPAMRNSRACVVCLVVLTLCVGAVLPVETEAGKKSRRGPHLQPALKIVDLNVDPNPFEVSNGPLQFHVTVQLPNKLDDGTVLEVTSLISSPSKTSLRFLTHRQPVDVVMPEADPTDKPNLSIKLSWDGQDHRKQPAGPGTYSYEVRTKLLVNGEKGLRTIMVAWPKRGTVEVKTHSEGGQSEGGQNEDIQSESVQSEDGQSEASE